MFSENVIYLSVTRPVYDNPKVTQGLAGMAQWLLPDPDLIERRMMRDMWEGNLIAPDASFCVAQLQASKTEARHGSTFNRLRTFDYGDFLTNPTARISCPSNRRAEWASALVHPRKSDSNLRGDWVYLSLQLQSEVRRGWQDSAKYTATERDTGRMIDEILVPLVFPSDGWKGTYTREYSGKGHGGTPLTRMNIWYKAEMLHINDRLREVNARLKEYQGEDPAARLGPAMAAAVKTQENRRRKLMKGKHEAGVKYQRLLTEISTNQQLLDRIVLARGWKALMMAGMQAMELTITEQDI